MRVSTGCLAAIAVALFCCVPAQAASTVMMGQTSGGVLVPIQVDSAGIVQTNATSAGTSAATQSGVWNITSLLNALPAGANVIGGVTQSGGPWSISAASLPLPTGAAQAALQTNGQQITGIYGGSRTANVLNSAPTTSENGVVTRPVTILTATDASGTITVGGTAQSAFSQSGVGSWRLQNGSLTQFMCFSDTGTAAVSGSGCAAGSYYIPPLGAWVSGTDVAGGGGGGTLTLSVVGPGTAQVFSCTYYK